MVIIAIGKTGCEGAGMHIYKEYCGNQVVLRTEHYTKKLGYILMLFFEARKDFPNLHPKDVEVICYAGRRYSKTYGIEFEKPKGTIVPDNYSPLLQLEEVFA